MSKAREDLLLAPYALALGFELRGPDDREFSISLFDQSTGLPIKGLHFEMSDVHVWETARGWRVSLLIDGKFERPTDSDFYRKLKPALEAAVRKGDAEMTRLGGNR